MNPREKQLAESSMWPLIFKFSTPAIIGMLANALYSIINGIYIGNIKGIGSAALDGIGVTFPIVNTALAFTLLLGIGAAANVSIHMGKKDYKGAEQVLGNTFVLAIIISVILSILSIIFADSILVFFGASPEMLVYASPYLKIYFLGTIFFITGISMNHLIRGSGNPTISAATQVLGAVLNAILDPIFIFVFKLGVEGAAIATVISQFISFLWVIKYVFSKKSTLKMRRENLILRWSILWRIFAIGASPFFLQVFTSAVSIVANHSLKAYGGDDAIGAMTIITRVSLLFVMPIFGLNQGLQPILGYNYGARNYSRVKTAIKYQIYVATAYVVLCFIAVRLVTPTIVSFFASGEQHARLVEITTVGLPIFFLALPLLGFQIPVTNYFQSIGRALVSLMVTLLRQVILLIPLYLILPKFWGLTGIWYAAPISDTVATILTAVVLIFEWRRLNALNHPLGAVISKPITE